MSKEQWITETVELAKTELKQRMENILELDGLDEDYVQDPDLVRRMEEGNAWLHSNAKCIEIGIAGFRKRHGYTQDDLKRMRAALGPSALAAVSIKEDVEASQQAMKAPLQK